MPLNILAWNNKIGPWYYFVGLRTEVMINISGVRSVLTTLAQTDQNPSIRSQARAMLAQVPEMD